MKIIIFDELDSTNNYLKDNFSTYENETVIRALKQTNGRGRFDRVWKSYNDLTFSILFKKSFPHHFIAPLAVHFSFINEKLNSIIKWPNDILVDGKKVCGILIERIFDNKISNDIVGIGINIEKRDDYNYLSKYNIDERKLLEKVLNMYKYFISLSISELKKYYIDNCNILNKEVLFNEKKYKVKDVNDLGELVITDGLNYKVINANEIDYTTMVISK